MYMIALYTPNYYEGKYFAHFKHTVKINAHILHIISKIRINNYYTHK